MANVTEIAQFDSGVYQLETTDPVQGGASGVANTQAKALANRTQWLKQQATFKHLLRGVAAANLEVVGSANVNVNKASDYYGKLVPVYHNDPGGTDVGTITLLTSDLTSDDYGTTVRFLVSTSGIEGTRVDIKVGATVLGSLFNTPSSYVEVTYDGTTWVLATDTIAGFTGSVVAFARNTAPQGFLKANGAAISRTTYARLFAIIGTTFGVGNGSTTFNLPDLRGEFIRGWADDRAVDTGRVFGSAQADELKAHTHTYRGATITPTGSDPTGTGSTFTTGNTGSTGGTETRPRNIALLYCIKF